ncbi:hypothetical protein [Streptosporangium sp. KLBMP 9127]|nr:hypothetical protein [Streptosporangium sp. KLBMP 9127]
MRVASILKKTAIFATVGVALSIIPAAGASASNSTTSSAPQRSLSSNCHLDSYRWAAGSVYYTPKNGYDEIDKIEYTGRGIGYKNSVRFRIRQDVPHLPDLTQWSWTLREGGNGASKDPNIKMKYSSKWHVDLKATFHAKGIDPSCTARTRSV